MPLTAAGMSGAAVIGGVRITSRTLKTLMPKVSRRPVRMIGSEGKQQYLQLVGTGQPGASINILQQFGHCITSRRERIGWQSSLSAKSSLMALITGSLIRNITPFISA